MDSSWVVAIACIAFQMGCVATRLTVYWVSKKMCKNNCMNACSSWQQWIKALVIVLYSLFVLIVVPWLIVYTVKDGFTRKDQLILIGGLFVITSVPLCIWHILQHMLHFTKPSLQKPIIRILWMVPIYSGNAVCFQHKMHFTRQSPFHFKWTLRRKKKYCRRKKKLFVRVTRLI